MVPSIIIFLLLEGEQADLMLVMIYATSVDSIWGFLTRDIESIELFCYSGKRKSTEEY